MNREDNEYMSVLNALGLVLEKNKQELAIAKYDVKKLREKLKEAQAEITKLKGE